MRKTKILCGAAAVVLFGTVWASAQDKQQDNTSAQPSMDQSQPATSPDHTVPSPPHAQPQAPIADQSKPAAVGPAQANTAGSMAENSPPGATRQTMPTTVSAENNALDKLPTTALQLPLSDAEKTLIVKSLAGAGQVQTNADMANVRVADFLPSAVPLREFPAEVTNQVPQVGPYKYVKLESRLLIVDPPNLTVVGDLAL